MENRYSKHVTPTNVPQSEPLDESQVKNNAGGYVYQVEKWQQLRRFIIIGTEGGTYYCSEQNIVKSNYKNVLACIKEDEQRVLDEILSISNEGLALKNDPAIFVLALCVTNATDKSKNWIKDNLFKICRIGTHLFMFAEFCKDLKKGWGRSFKNTISKWYLDKPIDKLAIQVLKYQNRNGWSHRDMLRLSHAKTKDSVKNAIFKWIVSGEIIEGLPDYIKDYEARMKKTEDIKVVIELTKKYNYSWEMIPTQFRTKPEIWEALVDNLGYTALLRNLGNMSKNEYLINSNKDAIKKVCSILTDDEKIKSSRIHPFTILLAIKNYSAGKGFRGKGEWGVVRAIVDALEEAYEKSFKYSTPTGKRILIAVDVSGSMNCNINNTNLTAREAAMAIANVLLRREANADLVAFTDGTNKDRKYFKNGLLELNHLKNYNFEQLVNYTQQLPLERTDCALPMLYAQKSNKQYDAIYIITDNETWFGSIHPSEALKEYRRKLNLNTKLVVCGVTATSFSIADPLDRGMLDVVGFDASLPILLDNFIMGKI